MIETLLEAERLLVMGMLDQAERLYSRTAEADPRNAMALVGLARVAVERGDDRLAYGHACAALAIDPQNAAALRLEARLSEVMAVRGDIVQRPPWLDTGAPPEPRPSPVAAEREPRVGETAGADDLGMLAQRTVLARNRSMTDHRRMNEQPPPIEHRPAAGGQPDTAGADRSAPTSRRGLLRRLLGR